MMPDHSRLTAPYEIVFDGRTVWVNHQSGVCIGRFSIFGIDIHADAESQMRGKTCILCTHERPGQNEWQRFKTNMMKFHNVRIEDIHKPDFLVRADLGRV